MNHAPAPHPDIVALTKLDMEAQALVTRARIRVGEAEAARIAKEAIASAGRAFKRQLHALLAEKGGA